MSVEVSVVEGSRCYQVSNYQVECGILLLEDSTNIGIASLWILSLNVHECLLSKSKKYFVFRAC